MTDEYKEMVKKAWKVLGIDREDTRDFVTAVTDLVAERDKLAEENFKLKDQRLVRDGDTEEDRMWRGGDY